MELEREEAQLEVEFAQQAASLAEGIEALTEEQQRDLARVRKRKSQIVTQHRLKKNSANNRSALPARHNARGNLTTGEMKKSLGALGIDTATAVERIRERAQSRGRKRERSRSAAAAADGEGDVAMDDATPQKRLHSTKSRSVSRGRSLSAVEPRGLRDSAMQSKALKMQDRSQFRRNKMAKSGEADRVILTKMPKHLFSGKRKQGTHDWR